MLKKIMRMSKSFSNKLQRDAVSAYSAQAAFYVILSFIPFLIFMLTLIKFLPITGDEIIQWLMEQLPTSIHDFIKAIVDEVFQKTSTTLLSISVVAALWSASKGFMAIIRGLNAVYGSPILKNYFISRILSVFYTFIFTIVLLLTLLLLGFGNQIYLWIQYRFPVLEEAAFLVISVRTVVFLLVLFTFFIVMYMVIPQHPIKLRYELPGALLSACGWMGFSYLYALYIDRMSQYSAMYGSLTAIVLCMIWLYSCMYIMFFGAEINVLLASNRISESLTILIAELRKEKARKKAKKAEDAAARAEKLGAGAENEAADEED